MDINDYLIDQSGKNWTPLFQSWMPPLPPTFTLWLVNRFGDAIVVFDDESVHLLDLGGGRLSRLADHRTQFADLIDKDGNADNWLLISLVDECRRAGMHLDNHQCYGFKVPPMMGGLYEVSNVQPTDLSVHYHVLAQVHQQTKDLPRSTASRSAAPKDSK